MIQEYIDYINNLMKENQALTVVFGGGILYQIIHYLKLIYFYVKKVWLYYFSHKYIINQADDYRLYNIALNCLKTIVKNPRSEKIYSPFNDTDIYPKISVGKHIGFYKFHYIEIIISELDKTAIEKNVESCIINIYGFRPRKIANILRNEIEESYIKANKKSTMTWKVSGGNICGRYNVIKRSINNLFINNDTKNHLLNVINEFIKTDKFTKFGIKKKLGLLLHGPPGTGKSTFPLILSEMLERDIYNIAPTEVALKSATSGHFGSMNSIIVIDDIDSLKISHDRINEHNNKREDEINISTLLSFLDGLDLPNDIIIIASTNNLSKLDPAVIRHGRFDYIIEFPQADYEVAHEMVSTLCPERMDILEEFYYPVSQAEIQARLLCN